MVGPLPFAPSLTVGPMPFAPSLTVGFLHPAPSLTVGFLPLAPSLTVGFLPLAPSLMVGFLPLARFRSVACAIRQAVASPVPATIHRPLPSVTRQQPFDLPDRTAMPARLLDDVQLA